MSCARLDELPEDILRDIYHLVAEDYLREGNQDGFRRCCKLAGALPCLSRLSLPCAPLKQWEREHLSWEGIKWALLRQPSASLLHIAVLEGQPITLTDGVFEGPHSQCTWRGRMEEQEEDDEEIEAYMEVSEDTRGFRALVRTEPSAPEYLLTQYGPLFKSLSQSETLSPCGEVLKFFPRYDADKHTVPSILQRLRPWVQKLLQLGIADLHGLKINADSIPCPKVLGQFPLRHLELEVGKSSMSHLKDITTALGQCTTLEYLNNAGDKRSYCMKELADLQLRKAPSLKRVHIQSLFPIGRLCLPPGCQLRLDLDRHPYSWDQTWQSEDGQELVSCIPAMCLNFLHGEPLPSNFQAFKVLQYLELQSPDNPIDLAWLGSIPHVRLEFYNQHATISHTAGSWKSLEIFVWEGFEIQFANIDAFVRKNPQYLFETYKITMAWRNMSNALYVASERQGVGCFPHKCADGSYSRRLSSVKGVAESSNTYLASAEDFWPNEGMRSCLASIAPRPKVTKRQAVQDANHESPVKLAADLEALPTHIHMEPTGQRTLRGRLTWLVHKLNPIDSCTCGL